MKIIKHGKARKVFIGTCDCCESIIEANKDELKGPFIKDDTVHYTGRCPVCAENNNYSCIVFEIKRQESQQQRNKGTDD